MESAGQLVADPWSHAVQFYDRDDELISSVGCYLAAGLRAREPAIVMATPAHLRALESAIAATGIDIAAAEAAGSFIALDAAEVMRRFLIGDWPDHGGFDSAIGGLIRRSAWSGRPVRVYGEFVALLWQAGQVIAAIEIEVRWNDLGRRLPFSLLCGYPAIMASGFGGPAAVAEVCRLHSALIGSRPAVTGDDAVPDRAPAAIRSFTLTDGAPRAARRFVLETVQAWGDEEFVVNAGIVVAELAGNAVKHARTDFTVAIFRTASAVRILVRDSGPMPSANDHSSLLARDGHGLAVVATLASSWAAMPLPWGKAVWAELPAGSAGDRRG